MGKPVPEREAAKAAGERFYWTGKPCKNGHLSKRYTGTGICAMCAVKNTLASQAKAPWHPNRLAAKERGELHYSTGKECPHGHDRRLVSNGHCIECDTRKSKAYHAANPGMEARWARERRAKDPTGHRKSSVKWIKSNPDKVKVIRKRMFAKDPEGWRKKLAAYTNARRAREASAAGTYTVTDVDRLFELQHGKCAACFKSGKLQVDHVVAIANGGSNDPSNLQLLCGTCNKSKGKKDAILWAQEHGRLL